MKTKKINIIVLSVISIVSVIATLAVLYIIGSFLPSDNITANEVRTSFIEGCAEVDGVSYQFCNCAYEKIHADVGTDGIIKMSKENERTGELDDIAYKAIFMCVDEL